MIDKWIKNYIVFCPQVTLCGWRDVKIQELRRGRGPSECGLWTWQTLGEQPVLWTLQTLKSTDEEWPTEQYAPWTLQTLNWHWTLNPTDNWILEWTLPTLNKTRQTMNAVDCNPDNTEHHWRCMLQTLPWRLLKKLNWCWTLLALNAIEAEPTLSRLTLNLTLCTLNPTDT